MTTAEATQTDWQSMVIPGFSVLKMKQEIQDKIYRETKDMTTAEFLAYVRRGSEAFRREGEVLRAKQNDALAVD